MSAAGFEKRLSRLAQVPDAAVRASALAVVKIAEREGGTVTLGTKRRRVKLGAVVRVKGNRPDEASVTVWGRPTGPWVWQTSGTGAHLIPKRKPTAKKPRPIHGKGFEHPIQRTQVHHPGTGGRGAWRNVQERAGRIVPEIFRQELHKVVNSG